MAQRPSPLEPSRSPSPRLHTLALPLAVGVFVVGAAAALFRPAFPVNGPISPTLVAGAKLTVDKSVRTDKRQTEALTTTDVAELITGRSVDVGRIVLPADEAERLYTRGQTLADAGDFAAARLLLARAAEAGHARAIFALAATYDPNVLSAKGARGLVGEPTEAKALYARALAAGVGDARARMDALGG